MAIYSLNIPYPNFEIGKVIDPSEFNANNGAIQTKVNEVVNAVNNINIVDDDGNVVVPSYIKETFIDPVEIKSPLITGNTLIGTSGIVGMTSVGTSNSSVRFWAGSSNKDAAPFRVTHDGSVTMTKASLETTSLNGKNIKISQDYIRSFEGQKEVFSLSSDENGNFAKLVLSQYYDGGDVNILENNPSFSVYYYKSKMQSSVMIGHGFMANGGDGQSRNGAGRIALYDYSVNTNYRQADIFLNSSTTTGASFFKGNLALGKTTANYKLDVQGDINLTGSIYVNGVKMNLTPA